MKSQKGELKTTTTKSGQVKYQLEIEHQGLNKFQTVRGDNRFVVQQKAAATMNQWDMLWTRLGEKQTQAANIQEKKAQAIQRTTEAESNLNDLENILSHTLSIDDTVNWDNLKNNTEFSAPFPIPPNIPPKPQKDNAKYQLNLSILDRLISSRKMEKEKQANEKFAEDLNVWASLKDNADKKYEAEVTTWQSKRAKYEEERENANLAIEEQKQDYLAGKDAQAIKDYCDMVLSNSEYPSCFPQSFELDFNLETKVLVLDYELPSAQEIPTLKEVRYIQSKDEFVEKHMSEIQRNKSYDNLIYQITLRTIHELYEADRINGITSIVFNGYVNSIDRATGQRTHSCILSLQAKKDEFNQINLAHVDPKACFKKLKGISASRLHSLTPVAPIMNIDREDSRFVSSYDVAHSVEGENLAAMDWEDFEHLIRELFEKEFAASGGEVKVTQASRDGGIDAVVFDPDPIRGGKIVIQAKRYTNTVGVSAVRDLYGTLINEGANKGILVTTADYGPDAHEFAQGKPMSLLSGAQLLYLLEKHGHKARIDVKEAKQIIASKK